MKKIIAATAGLMLAGSIVASANAAKIDFGGDARARFNYRDNYQNAAKAAPQDTEESFWSSRVRLQFKIETKGGAYAVGRFRLADGTWDGSNNTAKNSTLAYGEKSNLFVDQAYVGVPIGPITIEAGTGLNTMNEFLRADDAYDFVRAIYANENAGTTVVAFMEKLDEYQERTVSTTNPITGLTTDSTVIDDGYTNDDDVDQYGINLIQKFGGSWTMNGLVLYRNDQQADNDGLAADFLFSGKAGDISLFAEVGYKEADYQGSDDDGYGGYVGARIPLGIASISMIAGATSDGFTASGDFGGDGQDYAPFVMLSKANTEVLGMMNTGVLIGSAAGDSYFFHVAPSVKVSDKLTLTAEGTYMNADYAFTSGTRDLDIFEIGGIASYKVTEGASLTALLGYLDIEDADENPLGFGLALDLKF
ncbi:MAG: hypothetical protein LBU39_04935 [Desulfobulbaceae bacterium]|jgi:hypothetical protein|nr:hypothetical protein [Desulfobulbaceae bacterium]